MYTRVQASQDGGSGRRFALARGLVTSARYSQESTERLRGRNVMRVDGPMDGVSQWGQLQGFSCPMSPRRELDDVCSEALRLMYLK